MWHILNILNLTDRSDKYIHIQMKTACPLFLFGLPPLILFNASVAKMTKNKLTERERERERQKEKDRKTDTYNY